MAEKKCVMISSTARDLPEHRKEVMDACLRQGMFPVMMEHLPASDDEAISASLKMVDEADIYVGVFAYRYGYIPKGKKKNPRQISVTEMEYNRAVERKIPRCIFIIDDDHPIKVSDVEKGEGVAKLEAFKKRMLAENIVNFFKSSIELRAHVINSLSYHRAPDFTAFHYVSDIPAPPEAYIAHPYTLLQTRQLIGRQAELNLLTDWVAKPQSEIYQARIMSIVAIGGMGKSALTWKWFNDIAPQEMKPLAGRMWWSFYESDASFENFVIRALAYVTRRPHEEVQKILPPEREEQLLAILDREPFLLVLDGLERILLAYARMDAARLDDVRVDNQRNLRRTADPRVGSFLKKLANIRNSRILVSSRLYPNELETETDEPIPGSYRHNIGGLIDNDAVELWHAFGIVGSRDELLPIFTRFDKHPLLIQALAGEVKNYRRAPGNLAAWRKANPRFDFAKSMHVQDAMVHVLEYALRGLDGKARKVLEVIAALRMPVGYDALVALLVKVASTEPTPEDNEEDLGPFSNWSLPGKINKRDLQIALISPPCADEQGLDVVLSELEDRGLVGWDKRANRYDLHPIVRGMVWSRVPDDIRKGIFTSQYMYFNSVPKIDNDKIKSIEDLTPAIELYNTFIGLGRYADAYGVFISLISYPATFRLSASLQRAELLEMLFPNGLEKPPWSSSNLGERIFEDLAEAYRNLGTPRRAMLLYQQSIKSLGFARRQVVVALADTLRISGELYRAEIFSKRQLLINRYDDRDYNSVQFTEWFGMRQLGLLLATRGAVKDSKIAFERTKLLVVVRESGLWVIRSMYKQLPSPIKRFIMLMTPEGRWLTIFQAQLELWLRNFATVNSLIAHIYKVSLGVHYEVELISVWRLQGAAALGLKHYAKADERLHHTLTRARAVNFVEEELPALIALAELRRRQKDLKAARALLDDVWEYAERGPYPLFHADAFNVLAQIERDAGNNAAAAEAATKAYRLAWCDGEPYAYHWGLVAARKHLKELGAPEPEMPPFDESKFEPMPDVEINPNDEFHVDENEMEK